MGTFATEELENKEFSPKEIREMLGIDNVRIQELCKFADIRLKKNNKGLTYFTTDDVKILKSASASDKTTVENPITKLPVKKENSSYAALQIQQLIDTVKNIEKSMTEKVIGVLDEKLDGMDDVVMELIRVKSENENMRFKINELNKENYKLKKELNSFKKVPFGFYTKTTPDVSLF